MVVEPHHRHVVHLKRVVVERVLVRVRLLKVVVLVNRRHDVQVVVRCVRVWGLVCDVVQLLVPVQLSQHCFWMLLFDRLDVRNLSEVQLVDLVAHVQSFDVVLHHHAREYILVAVAADVEIPGHFFDCEGSHQPASVIFAECLFGQLVLSNLVGLSEQLVISAFDSLS